LVIHGVPQKCDEAVQVALHGFGQHEYPICARPRRLAPAITASNFDFGVSFKPRSTFVSRHRFCAVRATRRSHVVVAFDVSAS
jgi:hypothetical protein